MKQELPEYLKKMAIDIIKGNPKTKDPVKYRKLVNQFRKEWVEKSKNTSIQILDTAQNFSIWLDKNKYQIKRSE